MFPFPLHAPNHFHSSSVRQLELGLKTTSGVADVSSCCDSISSNHLHLYTFFCAVADFVHISTCLYGQIASALGSSRLCSPITAIRGRLLNRGWCLILLPFHIINDLPLYTGQGLSSAECWHCFAPSLYRKNPLPLSYNSLGVTSHFGSAVLSTKCQVSRKHQGLPRISAENAARVLEAQI